MPIETFWRMLENATLVRWDGKREYCLVYLPGLGYRLYRRERHWVLLLVVGPEARRWAATFGVEVDGAAA
jgi:hypothetical protein